MNINTIMQDLKPKLIPLIIPVNDGLDQISKIRYLPLISGKYISVR